MNLGVVQALLIGAGTAMLSSIPMGDLAAANYRSAIHRDPEYRLFVLGYLMNGNSTTCPGFQFVVEDGTLGTLDMRAALVEPGDSDWSILSTPADFERARIRDRVFQYTVDCIPKPLLTASKIWSRSQYIMGNYFPVLTMAFSGLIISSGLLAMLAASPYAEECDENEPRPANSSKPAQQRPAQNEPKPENLSNSAQQCPLTEREGKNNSVMKLRKAAHTVVLALLFYLYMSTLYGIWYMAFGLVDILLIRFPDYIGASRNMWKWFVQFHNGANIIGLFISFAVGFILMCLPKKKSEEQMPGVDSIQSWAHPPSNNAMVQTCSDKEIKVECTENVGSVQESLVDAVQTTADLPGRVHESLVNAVHTTADLPGRAQESLVNAVQTTTDLLVNAVQTTADLPGGAQESLVDAVQTSADLLFE